MEISDFSYWLWPALSLAVYLWLWTLLRYCRFTSKAHTSASEPIDRPAEAEDELKKSMPCRNRGVPGIPRNWFVLWATWKETHNLKWVLTSLLMSLITASMITFLVYQGDSYRV
jgi:hypothetical protein